MTKFVTWIAVAVSLIAVPARAELLVFAAASLKEPVDRIAETLGDVTVSYGGSGTLARQVSLGAPADVVLLANVAWMDVLVADGHVRSESVADFASNALVLIGPAGSETVALTPNAVDAALGNGRLSVGLTEAVPAGIYAKAAMETLGLWNVVQDRLAEVDSVRAALALVIRGQAPLGIVYATDVRISDAVAALAVFPAESHPPIRYTAAVAADADEDAAAFLAYLLSAEGRAEFAASGFRPPVEPEH